MPEMDGFKATEEILNIDPGQSVVALTSYTNDQVRQRCKKIGFKNFVNKPLEFLEMKKLILKLIFDLNEDQSIVYLSQDEP